MAKKQETMIDIPVVLSKKVDSVIYNLMVRTTTDQIFRKEFSLTEILDNVQKSVDLKVDQTEFNMVKQKLATFFADAPEDFQTLMDVHNYIQSANDKIEATNKVLATKIDTSVYEGDKKKLMSQINQIKQDIVDINTASNDYVTKANFEERIKQLETDIRADMYKNLLAGDGDTAPAELIDGGFWIQYIEE